MVDLLLVLDSSFLFDFSQNSNEIHADVDAFPSIDRLPGGEGGDEIHDDMGAFPLVTYRLPC